MAASVILVDKNDQEIGSMEKLQAHKLGRLHRAFSVFIFNNKQELLLQKRSKGKYHSPSMWTNTCCSHPKTNEDLQKKKKKRLKEEMGIICELKKSFSFLYKVEMENRLIEHEIDHVFVGFSNDNPTVNTDEASGYQWTSLESLKKSIQNTPEQYTPWLKIIMTEHFSNLIKQSHVKSM